jgi:hypothetical protein
MFVSFETAREKELTSVANSIALSCVLSHSLL